MPHPRIRRRAVLAAAMAGAATAATAGALVRAPRAHAATILPMTVVNHTDRYANGQIWLYIVGVNPAGQQGYVRNGAFVPCSPADNGPDGFADLSVPLAADGDTGLTLPRMSGRVYVSIGTKLKFRVVTDGAGRPALQYPAGWVASDPNYPVLHDFIEFTLNADGMFCNTTAVDMFGIPMALRLTGAGDQTTGTLVEGGRANIFAALAALPDYQRLVVGDLRVIAPGHGIDAGLFRGDYLNGYINECWQRYTGTDLRVSTGAGTFTGRVVGDMLTFNGGVNPLRRPSTRDVFFCHGALAAPNDGLNGPVAAVLGSAINRTTLRDQANQPATGGYYQLPVTNHYARILHANMVDGRAYGFAFDDVLDRASYVQDLAPTRLTLRLTPFGTGGPPQNPGGRDAYANIAASSADQQQGTQTEPCSEGGQNVGWIANGDWLRLSGVDFGSTPARGFSVRVASGAGAGISGLVQVRVGSRTAAPVGSVAVGNTGGWQTWRTLPGGTGALTGVQDVYLTFASGQPADFVNVQWLRFTG